MNSQLVSYLYQLVHTAHLNCSLLYDDEFPNGRNVQIDVRSALNDQYVRNLPHAAEIEFNLVLA